MGQKGLGCGSCVIEQRLAGAGKIALGARVAACCGCTAEMWGEAVREPKRVRSFACWSTRGSWSAAAPAGAGECGAWRGRGGCWGARGKAELVAWVACWAGVGAGAPVRGASVGGCARGVAGGGGWGWLAVGGGARRTLESSLCCAVAGCVGAGGVWVDGRFRALGVSGALYTGCPCVFAVVLLAAGVIYRLR